MICVDSLVLEILVLEFYLSRIFEMFRYHGITRVDCSWNADKSNSFISTKLVSIASLHALWFTGKELPSALAQVLLFEVFRRQIRTIFSIITP